MSRRTNGRSWPSVGARILRRAEERRARRGLTEMVIPDVIRDLTPLPDLLTVADKRFADGYPIISTTHAELEEDAPYDAEPGRNHHA